MRIFALLFFALLVACSGPAPPTVNLGQPVIAAVSPNQVPISGGAALYVIGGGFDSGATVTVGGAKCLSQAVQSLNSIFCVVPAHAVGSVDVLVTNSNQRANGVSNELSYYNPAARAVAGFATLSGGGTVTGPGYNLQFTLGGPLPPAAPPEGAGFKDLAGLLGVLYGP